MRAAATVVRLMPSPRNTITFFALPPMAPLAAARAAPLRYHQSAVSPCGWATSGTSIGATRVAALAGATSRTLPLQAASRVARQAIGREADEVARMHGIREGERALCRDASNGMLRRAGGAGAACAARY